MDGSDKASADWLNCPDVRGEGKEEGFLANHWLESGMVFWWDWGGAGKAGGGRERNNWGPETGRRMKARSPQALESWKEDWPRRMEGQRKGKAAAWRGAAEAEFSHTHLK